MRISRKPLQPHLSEKGLKLAENNNTIQQIQQNSSLGLEQLKPADQCYIKLD